MFVVCDVVCQRNVPDRVAETIVGKEVHLPNDRRAAAASILGSNFQGGSDWHFLTIGRFCI